MTDAIKPTTPSTLGLPLAVIMDLGRGAGTGGDPYYYRSHKILPFVVKSSRENIAV
jgi:hypothetical protein